MNQKLTFTAFLQDEYSKKFDKLADRTDTDIKKIEKDLTKLSKTGKTAALSINDLNKRIDILTRVKKMSIDTRAIKFASNEIRALEQQKAKLEGIGKGGGMFGGFAGFAAAGIGLGVATVAKSFISRAVTANMEREQQRISMGVLTGGQANGDRMIGDITNMAARTPFETNDLVKSTQTMLGFGIAQEKVLPIMQRLGDISGGNNDRFQSLTLAFSQMSSTGRLMGQDLLQMINAGFNPLNIISQQTGKSMAVLKKEMEDGKISSNMVTGAIEKATNKGGLYFGMMDKQSQTTEGKLSTLRDNVNETAIAFGERMKPAIDGGIAGLSAITASVKKWIEIPASQKIQEQATNLRALKAQLMDTNIEESRRKEILIQIQDQYGPYLKNLDLEKASYEEINKALDNTIALLEKKSKKARLDEIMKDATDNLNVEYAAQASVVQGMYKIGAKIAPEIMNREGLTSDQRVALIQQKLNEKGAYGEGYKYGSERQSLYGTRTLDDINNGISKQQKNLKETSALVEKQMKDENLYNLDGTPKADADDKGGKGGGAKPTGTTKSGTSIPSISGGSRITHLIINIDALVKGGVNVYKATAKEGAVEMGNVVKEQLLTAVNDANLAVSRN